MKRLYTLFALLLTLNSWLHIAHAQDESTWMPDANLRTAVRNALGLANDDTLTQEVMTNLTELIAEKSDIANITGLEHATNLTDLRLTDNQITDISPLRNLTNLTRLLLSNNPIGDITDLGNLTNLQMLWVKNCGITDVSPLQTLVNLTTLRIAGNNLTNAHLLSTLTNLKDIDIKISDPPLIANDIDIMPPDPPPDVDPPGVRFTIPSGVQNGAFDVKIRFTESVLGFTASDLSLSGTATATASLTEWVITEENTNYIANNATTYIAIITPTTSGTVILNIAANVATDAANNPNTAATPQTVTVDVDRPTVTIGVPSETQTGAFDATLTFSETVSGFDQSDVSLTGSAANITAWRANSDNTVYTATITPTASGTLTINVAANVATDAANNPNTAATSQTVVVSLDTDAPSVSISVPSGVQNSAFDATITFSEVVSGFVQSELFLTGTATASITAWHTTDTTVYTATITPTTSGTVTLNVAANVATDAANNPNTAAISQTASVDVDAPSVSITVPSGDQTGAFDVTITFSESVSGFTQSDVSVSGTTNATLTALNTTDDTIYTATITPSISGTVILSVPADVATDAANNPNTASGRETITVLIAPQVVDTTSPGVSITVPDGVQNSAFDVTITFTEAVSGFVQSELSLGGTASASLTAWSANADDTVYTATITPTNSGTVVLNIAANVATDAANNPNTAATPQTVNVDVDRPTVTIGVPSETQTGAFNTTITFSETVSGFTQSDVYLTGSAASITAWNANTDNTVYTATITPTASGTVTIGVAANAATDAANNSNTAATAQTVTVSLDTNAPSVSISVPSSVQNSAFDATITFTETVSGFTQSDLSLTGTATASITAWNTTDNKTYTATITPTTSGTVIFNINARVATDAANNPNTAAITQTVNVDVDRPTVTISVPSETQTGAFDATITFSEAVSGFILHDVSLTGSAARITVWRVSGDKITYIATITPTASGTVTIGVPANVATDAAGNNNTAATAQTVRTHLQRPQLPPVHEPIDSYLATPAAGHIYEIPVVIMRFLPTSDGINLDVSKAPDYWSLNPISLRELKAKIDVFDKRVKFMLEEGSRFRGYKNPSTPPSIGYRVVKYITVYEQTPAGHVLKNNNGFPIYAPNYHQIFKRFNMEHYVNNLGVKEIWVWQGHIMPSFPAYDPNLHKPEDFRDWSESNMSSPTTGDISNSYRINNDLPVYNSTYTVYSQNIRRTHAEAVHNHGHQLEAILTYVDRNLFWKKFVGKNDINNHITGRAGWTHMPPNTTKHYDYTKNTKLVKSDIEDWTPGNSGSKKLFNVDTYGTLTYSWPDANPAIIPQRVESQWYIYWMQSMPGHKNGIQYGNKELTNWWVFTADWDTAISNGVRLTSQSEIDLALAPTVLGKSGTDIVAPHKLSTGCQHWRCGYAAREVVPGYLNADGRNAALPMNSKIVDLLDKTMLETLDPATLAAQLDILRAESDGSPKYRRTIKLIESILATRHPDKTRLLTNYPNPFNPETWIPYHLANPSNVSIIIYNMRGNVIRRLELGHQQAGYYTSRSRAVHWDGKNSVGEPVASGIYFYTLTAGNFSATRKMLIRKQYQMIFLV